MGFSFTLSISGDLMNPLLTQFFILTILKPELAPQQRICQFIQNIIVNLRIKFPNLQPQNPNPKMSTPKCQSLNIAFLPLPSLLQFDYSFSISISRMSSTSRFSRSRCNVPSENTSSLNLLHSGIKRKVSRQEYTKLFTKMRISSKLKLPQRDDQRFEERQAEMMRLRQEIAALEAKNGDLRGKISKEHKIDGILAKKLENVEVTDLDLNRAFEIKLILEVESLEDCLTQKTQELDMQVRQQKDKQHNVMDSYSTLLDVTAILLRDASLGPVLQQREQAMKESQARLALLRDKTKKMKEVKKTQMKQLQELQVFLDKLKEKLPNLNASTKDENNSSIYSTQVRAVTIESLERQIQQLKHETQQFQAKTQQLMQQKVKEKIAILKKIHEMQENPAIAKKRKSKKELLW